MKVLLVSGEYPPLPGGIADYTALLVAALRLKGIDGCVISTVGSHADRTIERWSWKTVGSIRREIDRQAIDIVHIQYQTGAFKMHPVINMLPRLVTRIPVVTTFHDLLPPYLFPKAGRLRNLSVNRLARWSDAAIVTNPADRRRLESRAIGAHEIPIGPSLPVPDENLKPGRHVGFFGYPSAHKGFDVLVRAIGQLDSIERPPLTVIGSRPQDTGIHGFFSVREAEQIAANHHVQLTWTGRLAPREASNALASCGVVAFPYPSGATLRSSALIAALQSGRPVVATHPRHADDLRSLANMTNLTLVQAGAIQPVASIIPTLISMPSVDCRLPDAFQWDSIADRHRELYARLHNEAIL
jgi:glycosyltransferase involved in cell wall biosynthesis